jgi:hypothetical protein
MYIVVVLLQTLVLPLVCGGIHLVVAGGNALVVLGIWWAFWGVGTRLLVAGISQIMNPGRTAKGILGAKDPAAEQVVQELGYANLAMGVVGLATAFAPGWGIVGSLPGAVFLGLAGLRHVAKSGKNRDETVATWTDLLVLVMVGLGVGAKLAGLQR